MPDPDRQREDSPPPTQRPDPAIAVFQHPPVPRQDADHNAQQDPPAPPDLDGPVGLDQEIQADEDLKLDFWYAVLAFYTQSFHIHTQSLNHPEGPELGGIEEILYLLDWIMLLRSVWELLRLWYKFLKNLGRRLREVM